MQLRLATLILAAAVSLCGQQYYRFAVDQDHLNGAPDFSFLNHPLTAADRIVVRNGHFYTVAGQRVRFFGISFAFGANFPDPSNGDAVRVAKRLRRMGINLVRLHHMDSEPDPVGDTSEFNSTLTTGPYPSFNDNALARLRAFLTALANQGIYVDLNLHVGYPFRPDVDNVPALSGAWPDQGKPLQVFYPRMVQLQQQYAQGLIQKLNLVNDPVLAMVEISNESSIVSSWQNGQLDSVLQGDYRTALQSQWNAWLTAKYGTTAALSQAWGTSTADGSQLLNGNWQLEVHTPAQATVTATTIDGIPTEQVHVSQGGNWVFLKQTGFSMTTGHRYLWTFQARANLAGGASYTAPISVMRDDSPWDGYLYSSITLTDQWQTYNIIANASFDITVNPPSQPNGGRVMIEVDGVGADTFFRGMSLVQAGQHGLTAGQSLEAGTVTLPGPTDNPTTVRLNDYVAFLTATDRNYVNTIRDTIQATGVTAPITGTQMGYGGLSIVDSQDGLDYQDNHFYIDHPNFPSVAWYPWDWRIQNIQAADQQWSSFLDMAWAREAGRPYTVSEFNEPWPNTHGIEIDPAIAAFAAFQNWDGIMHFDYAGGRNWDTPIPDAFDANGDWTKFPNMGQSAWLFRTAAVSPGLQPLDIPVTEQQRVAATASGQSAMQWATGALGVSQALAFTRRIQLAKDSTGPMPAVPAIDPPYVSSTHELIYNPGAKLFSIDARSVAGIFGNLGIGNVRTAGPIDVELVAPSDGFASVLVNALDNAPLRSSEHLLVSIPGAARRALPAPGNQAPNAATAVPQDLVNYLGNADWWTIDPTNAVATWGAYQGRTPPSGDMNSGYTPTFMSRTECWLTLRTAATSIAVTALDGAGNVIATLPDSQIQAVTGGFRIHLNAPGQAMSPWFVITATQPTPALAPHGRGHRH
ncbi:MAG TPA: hypothetical protein VMJ34_21700 [Bryobacteraceae bacterium]|nr:hypothetical protein [Bryobacteraceae bacterium]